MSVKVAPHIGKKDFGNDVLLFATPGKLATEAESILSGLSDRPRGNAFWEIFAKRANESMHLLDGNSICVILRAFSAHGGRSDLVSGLCHFVAEDLGSGKRLVPKYSSIMQLIEIMQALNSNSISVPASAYNTLVVGLSDLAYTIKVPGQVYDVMSQLKLMRSNSNQTSANERALVQQLAWKLGRPIEGDVSFDEVYTIASELRR